MVLPPALTGALSSNDGHSRNESPQRVPTRLARAAQTPRLPLYSPPTSQSGFHYYHESYGVLAIAFN